MSEVSLLTPDKYIIQAFPQFLQINLISQQFIFVATISVLWETIAINNWLVCYKIELF